MALVFPNLTRSFEASKGRVRFWGYDDAIELTFFLSLDVLLQLAPGKCRSETAALEIFDRMLPEIHEAARSAYAHGRRDEYAFALTPGDF